ncbi:MAG: GPW/gp25 family protein [Caldilineaceae bacterium]
MTSVRAWRFGHPDLDPGQPGLRLTPQHGIEMVAGDDTIRQAILLLLSTRPGERVMRPDYGCDIYRVLFAPNDETTAALAIHYVRRALLRWEPRIEIMSLDANRVGDDANHLVISLVYRVRMTRAVEEIEVTLNLAGGEG